MAKTITAALMQYRLITAEKQLLEQTLSGCLQVQRSTKPRKSGGIWPSGAGAPYIHHVVTAMKLGNPWQHEVAAILSQLGCVTLAGETIEAVYRGDTLSAADRHSTTPIRGGFRVTFQDPAAGTDSGMDDRTSKSSYLLRVKRLRAET